MLTDLLSIQLRIYIYSFRKLERQNSLYSKKQYTKLTHFIAASATTTTMTTIIIIINNFMVILHHLQHVNETVHHSVIMPVSSAWLFIFIVSS